LIGRLLDRRYRVDAPIASGGMSTVYRGTDTRLQRSVAIKVMNAQYAADPGFVSRFEFEALAVAQLRHPSLVAVYDKGNDDGTVFLVMELIEGGTLRELLRERGPMPPHAVAAVAAPVLSALAVAHNAGLIHRDVKPENILISQQGEVKIADFGLVRAASSASVTSKSVVLGTAAYLSPEQVVSGDADARSDIYAMGIVVFELLTGRLPFTGATPVAVAYQRVNHDVPMPSRLIGGVPSLFDALVAKATAREPAARFADAADMLAAMRETAARLNLPAYRVPAPRKQAPPFGPGMPAAPMVPQPAAPPVAPPPTPAPPAPPTLLQPAPPGAQPAALAQPPAPRVVWPPTPSTNTAELPHLPAHSPLEPAPTRTYSRAVPTQGSLGASGDAGAAREARARQPNIVPIALLVLLVLVAGAAAMMGWSMGMNW
jgi:serine/threonine-protein kinase